MPVTLQFDSLVPHSRRAVTAGRQVRARRARIINIRVRDNMLLRVFVDASSPSRRRGGNF